MLDNWSMLRRDCLLKAQKAVDDAVSPVVKEMMDTISALQAKLKKHMLVQRMSIKSWAKAPDKISQEELGMIVDTSSMKKLQPKVTSFPRKEGEGLWVCCCQSHAAGKCRTGFGQTASKCHADDATRCCMWLDIWWFLKGAWRPDQEIMIPFASRR